MSKTPDKSSADAKRQRKSLEDSERKATEQQPETFHDKATGEKHVEVGPDMTDAPIKHIDAPERPGSGR